MEIEGSNNVIHKIRSILKKEIEYTDQLEERRKNLNNKFNLLKRQKSVSSYRVDNTNYIKNIPQSDNKNKVEKVALDTENQAYQPQSKLKGILDYSFLGTGSREYNSSFYNEVVKTNENFGERLDFTTKAFIDGCNNTGNINSLVNEKINSINNQTNHHILKDLNESNNDINLNKLDFYEKQKLRQNIKLKTLQKLKEMQQIKADSEIKDFKANLNSKKIVEKLNINKKEKLYLLPNNKRSLRSLKEKNEKTNSSNSLNIYVCNLNYQNYYNIPSDAQSELSKAKITDDNLKHTEKDEKEIVTFKPQINKNKVSETDFLSWRMENENWLFQRNLKIENLKERQRKEMKSQENFNFKPKINTSSFSKRLLEKAKNVRENELTINTGHDIGKELYSYAKKYEENKKNLDKKYNYFTHIPKINNTTNTYKRFKVNKVVQIEEVYKEEDNNNKKKLVSKSKNKSNVKNKISPKNIIKGKDKQQETLYSFLSEKNAKRSFSNINSFHHSGLILENENILKIVRK